MIDDGSILSLLGCPLSSFSKELEGSGAKGCEDWLRDWLLRKHLELHGKNGDDEKSYSHIRSFFDSTETRDLALLVFSASSIGSNGNPGLDQVLEEMISSIPQSNRCTLFPTDILKLSQAIKETATRTINNLDSEPGKEDPSADDSSKLLKISTFKDLKGESSLISRKAMNFDSIFDEKIRPWITTSTSAYNHSNHTGKSQN